MPKFTFSNSAEIVTRFQETLDRFPHNDDKHGMAFTFCEFSAYLICPPDNTGNQLSQIVFPESIIGIPNADNALQRHHSLGHPRAALLSGVENDALFVKFTCSNNCDGNDTPALVVHTDDLFFAPSLWHCFGKDVQATLSHLGFSHEMSPENWATHMNSRFRSTRHVTHQVWNRSPAVCRELHIPMNLMGAVGTNGSYHCMPEYTLTALENNRYVHSLAGLEESEIPFELGDVHVHSIVNEMNALQRAVADIVGEDIVRRNPSVPDIIMRRISRANHNSLSMQHRGVGINAMVTFFGILTVDEHGRVRGARYLDFDDVDFEKLRRLNDRAEETVYSGNPDPGIIAEQYMYVDSVTKTTFGSAGSSEHVGC